MDGSGHANGGGTAGGKNFVRAFERRVAFLSYPGCTVSRVRTAVRTPLGKLAIRGVEFPSMRFATAGPDFRGSGPMVGSSPASPDPRAAGEGLAGRAWCGEALLPAGPPVAAEA